MWDLANGKLLRTITDAHPPGTAILHVKVHIHHTHNITITKVKIVTVSHTEFALGASWFGSLFSDLLFFPCFSV